MPTIEIEDYDGNTLMAFNLCNDQFQGCSLADVDGDDIFNTPGNKYRVQANSKQKIDLEYYISNLGMAELQDLILNCVEQLDSKRKATDYKNMGKIVYEERGKYALQIMKILMGQRE